MCRVRCQVGRFISFEYEEHEIYTKLAEAEAEAVAKFVRSAKV